MHKSPFHGFSAEFAEHKVYNPGESTKSIDWKLYARSDRYFVRDATRDSPLSVWLVIDTSASMAQADPERPDYARIDAARIIAACIAERAVQQGDSVGLITVGGRSTQGLPAAPGVRHRDRLLLLLAGLVADGRDGARATPPLLSAQIAADALVIVISDGFDDSLAESCERLAAARRDVRAIRILTVGETEFTFQGSQRFIDPESGRERTLDADPARSGFLDRFGAARREQLRGLARHGVTGVEHLLDEPADVPLHKLFAARGRSA